MQSRLCETLEFFDSKKKDFRWTLIVCLLYLNKGEDLNSGFDSNFLEIRMTVTVISIFRGQINIQFIFTMLHLLVNMTKFKF